MEQQIGSFEIWQSDIQGRLFERSLTMGYDSAAFIAAFMNSQTAVYLDRTYDRLQWAGEEYIMEELEDETGGLKPAGRQYDREVMYWTGYLYRFWHFLTGESSAEIYRQADARIMQQSYLGFHTLDPRMAVEDLKAMHEQRSGND